MSDQPQFPYEVNYQPQMTTPYGNAALLVKLAGIFNSIVAGLDIIWGLMFVVFGILFISGVIPASVFEDRSPPGLARPAGSTAPPVGIIGGVLIGVSILPLGAGVLKAIAGIKLLRRGKMAWGLTLAAGIIGCTELWCSYFCVIPMTVGIFTIVTCCLDNVRRYLHDAAEGPTPR